MSAGVLADFGTACYISFMAELPSNPTLADFQEYVAKMRLERGLDNSVEKDLNYLLEEAGELAKAIRKHTGGKIDPNSSVGTPEEESADVFLILLQIVNHIGFDLEAAVRIKEERNDNRVWV